MMTAKRACDVFISHAVSDLALAKEVATSLESAGLAPFYAGVVPPARDVTQAIWEALAESRAVVAIISQQTSPHAMGLIEIGAAAAWAKPVFVLLNGPPSMQPPAFLDAYPVYPVSRIEDIIRAIRGSFEPLTEEERDTLATIYRESKVPADQLSQSPKLLRHLATRFNRVARKQLSGERLLSELLRMRKRGQLPRLQPPTLKASPLGNRNHISPSKVRASPLAKRHR